MGRRAGDSQSGSLEHHIRDWASVLLLAAVFILLFKVDHHIAQSVHEVKVNRELGQQVRAISEQNRVTNERVEEQFKVFLADNDTYIRNHEKTQRIVCQIAEGAGVATPPDCPRP